MDEEKNIGNVEDAVKTLEKKGYKHEFGIDGDSLTIKRFDRKYGIDEVHLNGFYRFSDEIDTGDTPIIYALETDDNIKGYLVDMRDESSESIQKVMKQLKVDKDNSWRHIISINK